MKLLKDHVLLFDDRFLFSFPYSPACYGGRSTYSSHSDCLHDHLFGCRTVDVPGAHETNEMQGLNLFPSIT